VRDEKILEKLANHEVKDVSELFSLADKYARAVEGRAWHPQPTLEVEKDDKPKVDAAAQSSGKNNNRKKKSNNNNKPLAGAPTAAAITTVTSGSFDLRSDKRPRLLSDNDEGGLWCLVHNSRCHNTEECQEIKKLTK
jgi:hypothetical protein